MKTHLNWDGKQNNGIIFNSEYTWGALFKGAHLKPDLGIEYDSFQFGDAFEAKLNHITTKGKRQPFPKSLEPLVLSLAVNWVQEPNQEGGAVWLADRAKR